MKQEIKFVCNAVKWFDRANGNTYHSVNITRCSDGEVIKGKFQYGYGDHYQQTALEKMEENNWIPKKDIYSYERNNGYPILWNVYEGKKRECVQNGI